MEFLFELLRKHISGVSNERLEDFEKWLVETIWKTYIEDKMNNQIIKENKVNELNLQLKNATVNKQYVGQIELPKDLIESAEIVELPKGLEWSKGSLAPQNDSAITANEDLNTGTSEGESSELTSEGESAEPANDNAEVNATSSENISESVSAETANDNAEVNAASSEGTSEGESAEPANDNAEVNATSSENISESESAETANDNAEVNATSSENISESVSAETANDSADVNATSFEGTSEGKSAEPANDNAEVNATSFEGISESESAEPANDSAEVNATSFEGISESEVSETNNVEQKKDLELKDGQKLTADNLLSCLPDDKESINHIDSADSQDFEKIILKIYGKPECPEDGKITIKYKYKGWVEGDEYSIIDIPIVVNPNPRDLWKNIPTCKEILFYKEDSDKRYMDVKKNDPLKLYKNILAASRRGRSHAHEGKARDDHFNFLYNKDSDWYIIAVADGAGSAKYSRKGSEIVCNKAVEYCNEKLKNSIEFESKIKNYKESQNEEASRKEIADILYNIVGNAALSAYNAIGEEVRTRKKEEKNVDIKDFATTLVLAICKKFEFGWFIASYWVGDGAIAIFNENTKEVKLLGKPDEGEFSGQTRFLTMPEMFKDSQAVMERLRFYIEDDFTALMLMTDGVSDPMFETENNLKSYDKWVELWENLKKGFPDDDIPSVQLDDLNEKPDEQLLKWLDFWSPGNHDDRTIAILY